MYRYFKGVFIFYLLMVTANTQAQQINMMTVPQFKGGVKPNVIWAGEKQLYEKVLEECKGNHACNASFMNQLGASPQTVAFAMQTGGLVENYQQYGNIYYLKAWLPGARLRSGIYLGNSQGQMFRIDNWLDKSGNESLVNQMQYSAMKQIPVYQDTTSLYGCEVPPEQKTLPEGIQQLIFKYSLVNKCRGINGYVFIGFNFDQNGNFLNANFINITPNDPGYKLPIQGSCRDLMREKRKN